MPGETHLERWVAPIVGLSLPLERFDNLGGNPMARKVIVELIDDYDGKSKAEETVRFRLDGVEYEIDLSTKNARKLRVVFEQWTASGRRMGRGARSKSSATGRTVANREKTGAIRKWARDNGYTVSSRGRIQADIVEAYNKAS